MFDFHLKSVHQKQIRKFVKFSYFGLIAFSLIGFIVPQVQIQLIVCMGLVFLLQFWLYRSLFQSMELELQQAKISANQDQESIKRKFESELKDVKNALFEAVSERLIVETNVSEQTRQLADAHAKLISASRMGALGEMASGVSHEINNPLTILKGYLFLIQDQLNLPEIKVEKTVDLARKSIATADRIARIVKGLHEFSNQDLRDEVESTYLKKCWDRALTFTHERLVNQGVGLIVDEWDEAIQVLARPADLVQVMISLLLNSGDAISNLESRWIRIGVIMRENRVILRIQDSGNGIPASISTRIFDPFYTTKPPGSGVGLGLSIARTMIVSAGGDLRYLDEENHTTFEIDLEKSAQSEILNSDQAS